MAVDSDLAIDKPLHPGAYRLQLFWRRHSVGRRHRNRGEHLLLQARHADLEEVVEVLAEDGQEAHPFEEGQLRILRHRQDPFIEVEPGELAVDVAGTGERKDG